LIGGAAEGTGVSTALGNSPVPLEKAVELLLAGANHDELIPILMLQGSHDTAVRLARTYPKLALIQYSSAGDPPERLEYVGTTALATVGEHGKHIVRLAYDGGTFRDYKSIALGPEIKDDPAASRYYSAYLRRITSERLIDQIPRTETAAYVGSWTCAYCHAAASHVWKGSGHRFAFQTLAKLGHQADPDCVSCHVVGLTSTRGFRSMAATPELAGVGCESCHGPGRTHSLQPVAAKLPSIGEKACVGCHNPLNSPNFDFQAYWPKIAHR
jgi:hypothetical protein